MISEPSVPEAGDASLFGGRLICRQHPGGYRFSQDSVLLAHFFETSPFEKILDLGTGCGIIGMILAYRRPEIAVTGLEVQSRLAELARRNVAANQLSERINVVEGDLRNIENYCEAASYDRVVCNPPYRKLGSARINPQPEQAIARHEIIAGLDDIVKAACWVLVDGGRFDLVYPIDRLAELQERLRTAGCPLARLRKVYGYPGAVCRLVLVEAVKGCADSDPEILPPFHVRTRREAGYSPEMKRFYEP
ncbi:MAG: methyltransferase [Desulfobulbaceae bacterium]|nr:methyltransferase [Desulfobulbaceae bacterium]